MADHPSRPESQKRERVLKPSMIGPQGGEFPIKKKRKS